MQPDTQLDPNMSWGAPAPKSWWQRIPKLYYVGVILLVVVLVAIFAMAGGSKSNKQGGQANASVTYDRPGFDRKKLATSIGDPAALVLKKTAAPTTYQGTKIVQACSVFGPDEIKQTGLTLEPHPLTVAFQRDYFDGQGQGVLNPFDELEPVGNDSNDCQFTLLNASDKQETLWIQVYQTPYSTVAGLNGSLSRNYQDIGSVGGLKAYKYKSSSTDSGNTTTTLMRSGDAAVAVTSSIADAAKAAAVLDKVATNFTRLLAAPDGPSKVAFDSPLMPEGAVNACDILTAPDVKSVFNQEASPIATESVATAVGVVYFNGDPSKTRYNYAAHDCQRQPVKSEADISSFNTRYLKLEATSYRDLKGAETHMAFHKAKDKQVTEVNSKVGDDVFYSNPTGYQEELTVRKGRFILEFSLEDKQIAKAQRIQMLTSLAKTVVTRVK